MSATYENISSAHSLHLPALLSSTLWALECFALFIGLTIYGAMWKGAQDQGQRGWVVALIWAVALQLVVQTLKQIQLLMHHDHW